MNYTIEERALEQLRTYKTFPEKARFLREYVAVKTAKDMAKELQVSTQLIFYYENNCYSPNAKITSKYSKHFGVSPLDLYTAKDLKGDDYL